MEALSLTQVGMAGFVRNKKPSKEFKNQSQSGGGGGVVL